MLQTNAPHSDVKNIAIIGAGIAGLTLAHKLQEIENIQITLIDPLEARADHVFGFWDKGEPYLKLARELSKKSWRNWGISRNQETAILAGEAYVYRALNAKDYEGFLWDELKSKQNIIFQTAKVVEILREGSRKKIFMSNGLHGVFDIVFNSTPGKVPDRLFGETLLQHFHGWHVKFNEPCLQPDKISLMDFRVSQQKGTHFMYVLPFSATEALVESTVLSPYVQEKNWYEEQMARYLETYYINKDYEIISKEDGIIPMARLENHWRNDAIGIGMSGDALRVSSGYAFAQILAQIDMLVDSFKQSLHAGLPVEKISPAPVTDRLEHWMDGVFLKVLRQYPAKAPQIFYNMAAQMQGDHFAEFMRGHSSVATKLKLMAAVPKWPFIKKAIK